VWALYHRGRDDTAVFEAMKGAEVTVQKVIRCGSTLENECRLACIVEHDARKESPDQARRIGLAPKCPMSAQSASAPITHKNTPPSIRKPL